MKTPTYWKASEIKQTIKYNMYNNTSWQQIKVYKEKQT